MAAKKDAAYWKKYRAKKKVAQPDATMQPSATETATEITELCNRVATLEKRVDALEGHGPAILRTEAAICQAITGHRIVGDGGFHPAPK